MAVSGPLGKLDLCDERRPNPSAIFHFLPGERPWPASFLRQIRKRASANFQRFECLENLPARMWDKTISYLRGKMEPVTFVITDDEGIKRIARRIAADDEFLRAVHLVLDPVAAALARLIERALTLGDDALQA